MKRVKRSNDNHIINWPKRINAFNAKAKLKPNRT